MTTRTALGALGLFLLPILLFSSNLVVHSTHGEPQQQRPREAQEREMGTPVLGGYSDPIDVKNDSFVQKAARFAVDAQLTSGSPPRKYGFARDRMDDQNDVVIEVVEARQQVVEGINYSLLIALKDKSGLCIGAFRVTVWNHFGDMSVTNWGDEVPCQSLVAEPEGSADS